MSESFSKKEKKKTTSLKRFHWSETILAVKTSVYFATVCLIVPKLSRNDKKWIISFQEWQACQANVNTKFRHFLFERIFDAIFK